MLDENRFSKFFRDYLMSSGKYIPPKDTFVTFETRHEATQFSAKEVGEEVLASAKHYSIISGEQDDESAGVTSALAGLNLLESSTAYPLLLALSYRAQGAITSVQLERAIQMLRGFILPEIRVQRELQRLWPDVCSRPCARSRSAYQFARDISSRTGMAGR